MRHGIDHLAGAFGNPVGSLLWMHRAARVGTWCVGAGVVLLLSKLHARYVADPPYDFTGSSRFAWALAYSLILGVAAYVVGLPDQVPPGRRGLGRGLGAGVGAAGAVSAVQLLVGDALLPRFVVFGTVLVLVPAHLVLTVLARAGNARGEGRDRVVIVLDDSEHEQVRADVAFAPERPASLVALVTPEQATSVDGSPLLSAFAEARGSILVLDHRALEEPTIVAQAAELHESGVRVRTLSDFYEQWLGKLPLGELERSSLFFDILELHRGGSYLRMKRLVDVMLGIVGAVALAPVVILVVVANIAGNRGPLFFRQVRVGKNSRPFTILKFRTMLPVADPAAAHSRWTQPDDVRITSVGRMLRSSHLDELPQVWNILRGDLSVVGPRPEQPHYVEELSSKLPYYSMRHLVRPGLTGWAQVKYGYAGDERDALQKLQYEFYYLRRQSLALDVRTIVRTARSVTGGAGYGR